MSAYLPEDVMEAELRNAMDNLHAEQYTMDGVARSLWDLDAALYKRIRLYKGPEEKRYRDALVSVRREIQDICNLHGLRRPLPLSPPDFVQRERK